MRFAPPEVEKTQNDEQVDDLLWVTRDVQDKRICDLWWRCNNNNDRRYEVYDQSWKWRIACWPI